MKIKKWVAALLMLSLALGDFGGMMTTWAAENDMVKISTVSENDTDTDEALMNEEESAEEDASSESGEDAGLPEDPFPETDDETDPIPEERPASETDTDENGKTALPALHMGQVKDEEEFSSLKDDDIDYDLPVTFGDTDDILLFVNYHLNGTLDKEENGTLVWRILRGEKGTTAGTASLLDEADDWTDFEYVSDSPYFSLTEEEDVQDDYYKTAKVNAKDALDVDPDAYDYYIRAAFYPEPNPDEDDAFYAAVTVPFLPMENPEQEQTEDDTPDADNLPADRMADETSVSENTTDTETPSLSENTTDTLEEPSEDMANDESDIEKSGSVETPDDAPDETYADGEMSGTETVSENHIAEYETMAVDVPRSESGNASTQTAESTGVLTLSEENVTMRLGSEDKTLSVSAAVSPKNLLEKISWKSSAEGIATVTATAESGENATINAIAPGDALITAACGSMTATIRVKVVERDENGVQDLSGKIWVDGFQKENDALVYTGQKITQDIRVYHNQTLLKENTDYTLRYKNNINAAQWNAPKAPSVTITLKGQYSGSVTLYYTINPVDIKNTDIYNREENGTDGYEQAVTYAKTLKIPNPTLTFNGKSLAANKDFTCDYSTLPADYKKGDSYDAGKVYTYTVNGTGNFTGSIPMRLVVIKDKNLNFNTASVTLNKKEYEYLGTPLSKSEVTVEKVKVGSQVLNAGSYEYTVCTEGLKDSYVLIYPSAAGKAAGYRGCKRVNLKLIGGRDLKEAVPGEKWKESITFSQKILVEEGGIFQETENVLKFGNDSLVEGIDYTVKYTNAKKAGTATAAFTGLGKYRGTHKIKYTIAPNIDKTHFTILWKNVAKENGTLAIAYQKGGAVPDFVLKDQDGCVLKLKTDYTVKCTDNKTPGEPMRCEITGKGNYKGYTETISIQVTKGDIGQGTITLPDKPYSTKQDAWKSKATIKDVNGKTLKAGTDYEKELTYSYPNMAGGQSPATGTTVTVTARGINCYEGSEITGSYRIYDKSKSIGSLKIVIDPQEYTGKEIKLTSKNIHVYRTNADAKKKQNEMGDSCYEIVEYKNNIKAGNAKVTLHGIGEYGGTKTCSFKIQKKAYLKNGIKSIKLDKNKLSFSLQQKNIENRTLTATITPQTPEKPISNPTVIWTSSNSKVATVEGEVVNSTTVKGIIIPHKEGTVTITAITQDGNKQARCTVSIVDAPALKEAGQTIKKNVGETYQLSLDQEAGVSAPADIVWKSNNPDAVSVSSSGLLTMKKAGAAIIQMYRKSKPDYVQQCYAIAIDPNEKAPEGKVYTYEQKPGCTDDTPAINEFLRDWEWNTPDKYEALYIPAGVYRIDAVSDFGGIVLTDNQKLIMSSSALLIAIPNNKKNYQVINITGRNNVTVTGGQIIGERKEHTGSGGEWGHGIAVAGGTNITIENVEVSQCWGDGIYLGLYNGWDSNGKPKEYLSNGVTITNCNLHDNRRNNLSITDVSNVTVKNCQFSNAKGTAPQYGIDIEPNENHTCSNVTISDSTFKGNAGGTIQILGQLNGHVKGVTIENCTGDKKPVVWSGSGGSVSGVKETGNKW